MKSVVIGGNGFLGSHVVDLLCDMGHKVTAFDRYSSGGIKFNNKDVSLIRGDFLDRNDLAKAVQDQHYVFHFLSTTTPATAESDPSRDIRVNVTQSVELFSACANAGVQKVFFASSGGSIYGKTNAALLDEAAPVHPVSPYAIGKLALENYLEYFRLTTGMEYSILRISNPYGARQSATARQGIIPIVLRRVLNKEPVELYGDGSMVRDYLYIEDLLNMLRRIIEEKTTTHRVVNVGSGKGHDVLEIFDTIETVIGKALDIVRVPSIKTNADRVVLDTRLLEEAFGVRAQIDILTGIRLTWAELTSA